jgi:hypothetical protein
VAVANSRGRAGRKRIARACLTTSHIHKTE